MAWRWALFSLDGVAPSRMVSVSASVNLPLHHKVQKLSSGAGSPGWSRKRGRKTVVVVVVTTPSQAWFPRQKAPLGILGIGFYRPTALLSLHHHDKAREGEIIPAPTEVNSMLISSLNFNGTINVTYITFPQFMSYRIFSKTF